ncbi:MAG: lamin tail domain-containing protein [Crocinitomicaceae bacterium]|nr:lamin tail domain-containing protein [Crocinitomicaceae bacterium]
MRFYSLILLPVLVFTSCNEPEEIASPQRSQKIEITSPVIINEYSPKSEYENEFGEIADWIELYNTTDSAVRIINGEWSITDDLSEEDKFVLPDTVIEPHGFLLIWCDNYDGKSDGLHAPFKLSGKGEELILFNNGTEADRVSFDDVKKSVSYGRETDGNNEWKKFKHPTPGQSNTLFDNYTESRQ